MSNLSLVDTAFFAIETDEAKMQVASLAMLQPPADYDGYYANDLYTAFLENTEVKAPFNQKIRFRLTGLPHWVEDPKFDLSRHVFLHRLPRPGSFEQMQKFVSRTHTSKLDLRRPLWEMHIIDGMEDGQVGLMVRFHHSMMDGGRGMLMLNKFLETSADKETMVPFWQMDVVKKGRRRSLKDKLVRQARQTVKRAGMVTDAWKLSAKLTKNVLSSTMRIGERTLPIPFTAGRSPFNQKPQGKLSSVFGDLSIPAMNRIAKLSGGTINDVVLTVCDMALQRYMNDYGWMPAKHLTALMPINMRQPGNGNGGNKTIMSLIDLSEPGLSPTEVLSRIIGRTRKAKREYENLNKDLLNTYYIGVNVAALTSINLGFHKVVNPASNLVISNVPGPRETAYVMGARLNAFYPMSVLQPGQSLIITLISYDGKANIGIDFSSDSLPGIEQLPKLLVEALNVLEQAVTEEASSEVADLMELLKASNPEKQAPKLAAVEQQIV